MKSTYLRTLVAITGALLITSMSLSASSLKDDRIESSFRKTELYKQNLQNDNINISSNNGKVTLSGSAANASHRMIAKDAAESLHGVKSVDNRINVTGKSSCGCPDTDNTSCPATYSSGVPKTRFLSGAAPFICSNGNMGYSSSQRGPIDHYQTESDRSTTQSIRNAVFDDSSLDRAYNDISIQTVKGNVTLTGRVATQSEKDSIRSKAREFVNADRISNQIEVSNYVSSNKNDGFSTRSRGPIDHYQTQSDRSITQSIRSAIYDDSSLDRVYNDITISTVKGHVTLDGHEWPRQRDGRLQRANRRRYQAPSHCRP